MGDPVPTNLVLNDPLESPKPVSPTLSPPRSPRYTLKLAPLPSHPFPTQPAGTSASPSSTHRAVLTPGQAFHHAPGSFFAPEPHVHEDWIYQSTDTVPEASYSGSNSDSNPSPDLTSGTTPPTGSNSRHGSGQSAAPSGPATPAHSRPRARSHHVSSSSSAYYSSAHRCASPSFRSLVLLHFDRPPSPTSSISSHHSEPPMGASLSLSELLAGIARTPVDEPSLAPEDEQARREEQREERRLAMLARHTALIEQREKRRWSKIARAGCIEWVENNSKKPEW